MAKSAKQTGRKSDSERAEEHVKSKNKGTSKSKLKKRKTIIIRTILRIGVSGRVSAGVDTTYQNSIQILRKSRKFQSSVIID